MKTLVSASLFFFSLLALGEYHEIKTYSQKDWNMDFRGKYFLSDSNFSTGGGVYQALPNGYGYQLLDASMGFRSTIPERNWAVWGETQLAYVSAKSSSATRTNTGISYAKVGTDYILYEDVFTLIPEFSFTYPFVKNATNVDAAAIGEGVMEADARMLAQIRFRDFTMGGFAGFTYRDESRSSLVPYGIYAEIGKKTWSFGGNLRGYSSASFDKDSNNQTARQNWATNFNGGSYKFFMPNPQLLETNFWAQVRTTKQMNFLCGFGMTLNGANTANGWNVMAGMTYRFPTGKETEGNDDLNRFQEETKDGVDQTLFKKGANTPQKKRTRDDNGNLQDELDKTEMQIELKSNKRK